MVARTILAVLTGSGPCERLQVSLAQRADGRLMIDLREQHYADGIGWFDQRTMTLEPKQFQQLQAVLGIRGSFAFDVEGDVPATLPFPGPRTEAPRRSAVGDR